MITRTELLVWCETYLRANPVTEDTAKRMRRACELCATFTRGGLPDESAVSAMVKHLEASYAPKTIKNYRSYVLSVMRLAASAGATALLNHDLVRKVRVPAPNPVAWYPEEYERLVSAARRLKGHCAKRLDLPRAQYLSALVQAAYETGLRKGDLFRLTKDHFRPDGSIRLRQNKTTVPHTCGVTPDTLEMILAIPYYFPLRWDANPRTYSELWRDARKIAGLHSGATQQIRRTGATDVWIEDPEKSQ